MKASNPSSTGGVLPSVPSRRALLSRGAVLTAAGTLAGCLAPMPAPAAEVGPNPKLARLCARALILRAAEERLHDRRTTIAEEEATEDELCELQDEELNVLWDVAVFVPGSLADARLMSRLVYAVSGKAADGYLNHNLLCDVEGAIASRVVEYLADAPVGVEPGEVA